MALESKNAKTDGAPADLAPILADLSLKVLPPETLDAEWLKGLGKLIAPAVAQDHSVTLPEVKARLLAGELFCLGVAHPDARGVLVGEVCSLDDKMVLWASYIAGKVEGGPRKWLRFMRAMMWVLETHGRKHGCEEIRIGGRDWSRVFPGFEPLNAASVANGLRKALV